MPYDEGQQVSESTSAAARSDGGQRRGPLGWIAGLAVFYRQVVSELRKVNWPTRSELITYTLVVLLFVTIMITLVGLLDLGFAALVKQVFG